MDTLKKHHVRFSLPVGSAHSEITRPTVESRLKTIPGIKEASINFHNNDINEGEVTVKYDLKQCREEIIERWLASEGFVLDDPVLERFKRGFTKPTEDTSKSYAPYSHAKAIAKASKTFKRK